MPQPRPRRAAPLDDPAASANKRLALHRWTAWVAGFSAAFVGSVLDRFLPDAAPGSATVLDPFAGVGTTNVEALRRGLHSVGFELNPFAALAARCKLEGATTDLAALGALVQAYRAFMAERERRIDAWWARPAAARGPAPEPLPESAPPRLRTRTPFFSPPVELKVRWTLDFVRRLAAGPIERLFRLALGATLVSYSNYSYEPSLSARARAGRPPVENAPVAAAVAAKLEQFAGDLAELQRAVARLPALPAARIVEASCFAAPDLLAPGSVDLVVTSPPYLNNYHYPRNTRPQLYWLGFVERPADLRRLEAESFGRFWQTVRDRPPVPLAFRLPALEEQLAALRAQRPERGCYGGRGWANYAATYFNDCYRLLGLLRTLLRPRGHAVLVVGNSLLQGREFRVDQALAAIAALHGFEAQVERIRAKRVGTSIVGTGLRQPSAAGRPELYEAAVILRR